MSLKNPFYLVNERTLNLPTPLPTTEIQAKLQIMGVRISSNKMTTHIRWCCSYLFRLHRETQPFEVLYASFCGVVTYLWELCVSWLTQLQVFIILRLINLVTIKRGFNCLSVYWCNFLICNKGIRYISFSAQWLDINISIMFPCFCKNVLVQSADRHRANY